MMIIGNVIGRKFEWQLMIWYDRVRNIGRTGGRNGRRRMERESKWKGR